MSDSTADFLIFLDSNISDDSLHLDTLFIPDLIIERIKEKSPGSKIFVSIPDTYKGKLKKYPSLFTRDGSDDLPFWKKIFEQTGSSNIAVLKADSPFIDPGVIMEMCDLHSAYLSEFTFSENLPEGFSCEIISSALITQLPETDERTLPLSKVVRANINQFDVELFYKEPDIRDKRLNFRTSSPREKKILENIYSLHKGIPSYSEIKSVIENNPEALFVGPSYVEIELTGSCTLDCIFCYRKTLKNVRGYMTRELLEKILCGLREFNLPYTVCFGGSGEPLDHPEFYALAKMVIKEPLVELLIVETNGIKADRNFKSFITKPESSKIKVIINNNGLGSDSYKSLHGSDHFDTVLANLLSLKELNNSEERIFIQIMKINETDVLADESSQKSYLDRYYDFWEGHKIPIILQKQNIYFGRIQDKRYSDLSPVKRGPCWHLQRDLYILSDGTVPFCKQDVDGEYSAFSINDLAVKDIWGKRKILFTDNYRGKQARNPDCINCDEWYTFNF